MILSHRRAGNAAIRVDPTGSFVVQPAMSTAMRCISKSGRFANRLVPPGRELIEELLVAVHCPCGPRRPEIVLEEETVPSARL